MPSKNAKRKVWCHNLEKARKCKKQKLYGVSESETNSAFSTTNSKSHLDVPSSPCKSVHTNEAIVSTLRTWFGGSAMLADIANSPTTLLRQAARLFASPNSVLHSPSTINPSSLVDHSLPRVSSIPCSPRPVTVSGQLEHQSQSYPGVTCEDVEDEEDMVAIGGVRWREGPEAWPLNVLLEEVINEFSDGSMDDKTDDENDELELTKNSKEQRYGNLYGPWIPPTILEARAALTDLRNILHPPRKDGTGYKRPDFDPTFKGRLESMEKFLWKYVDINDDGTSHAKNSAGGKWTQAADETARFLHGHKWLS
ncbi:hypothetical protein F4604DRAFT_1925793 [Suillus subluteus]|nr:hypothetical protein F4604DRAFT_1925793 [Suillus subluteus]